jgi:predicted Kef-type K+ transport protein
MLHHTPLIAVIVFGFVPAVVSGAVVRRAKLPPVAGYLQRLGASVTIMGENEIARAMAEHAV